MAEDQRIRESGLGEMFRTGGRVERESDGGEAEEKRRRRGEVEWRGEREVRRRRGARSAGAVIVTLGRPGQVEWWRRTVMGSWRFLFLADEQRDGRGACR